MDLRLGTVAPVGFEQFSPRWFEPMRRLGCTVVQAYRNPARRMSAAQVRCGLAASGLPCDSLHGVFGADYDPSSPDERVRAATVEAYKRDGELALAIGGPLVVVHCGPESQFPVSPDEHATRLGQLTKSIEELAAFGEPAQVRYAFENLLPTHAMGGDVGELASLFDRVPSTAVGLCLDTGHAHIAGQAPASVLAAGRRLIYVHFSDNLARSDDHDMPSCGTLDMDATAKALARVGYRGTIMLEVFYDGDRMQRLIDGGLGERLRRFMNTVAGG